MSLRWDPVGHISGFHTAQNTLALRTRPLGSKGFGEVSTSMGSSNMQSMCDKAGEGPVFG
jgi:hypothetical protein